MKENVIKTALQDLLNNLDKVAAKHPEIFDTAVREELHYFIRDNYILNLNNLPLNAEHDYQMFTKRGNKKIHKALSAFLNHPDVIAARTEITSPIERLAAFQDEEVQTAEGNSYGDYFGWLDGKYLSN